jgi:hypothetical protein
MSFDRLHLRLIWARPAIAFSDLVSSYFLGYGVVSPKPSLRIYIPQRQDSPVISPGNGFLSCDTQVYDGVILLRPNTESLSLSTMLTFYVLVLVIYFATISLISSFRLNIYLIFSYAC